MDLVINYLLLIEDDAHLRCSYTMLIENDLFKHNRCKKKEYFELALIDLYDLNQELRITVDEGDMKILKLMNKVPSNS